MTPRTKSGCGCPALLEARADRSSGGTSVSPRKRCSRASRGGITEAGCDVADIGLCDTPAVYFATAHYGVDGSVMITASHNPPEYNGLKVSRRMAVPVGYDTGLAELERRRCRRRPRAPRRARRAP